MSDYITSAKSSLKGLLGETQSQEGEPVRFSASGWGSSSYNHGGASVQTTEGGNGASSRAGVSGWGWTESDGSSDWGSVPSDQKGSRTESAVGDSSKSSWGAEKKPASPPQESWQNPALKSGAATMGKSSAKVFGGFGDDGVSEDWDWSAADGWDNGKGKK